MCTLVSDGRKKLVSPIVQFQLLSKSSGLESPGLAPQTGRSPGQVSSIKYQVSSIKYQVSSIKYQVSSLKLVGSQGSHKNSGSHIDASHSRQPLVKGERLVRYEVNAVIITPVVADASIHLEWVPL